MMAEVQESFDICPDMVRLPWMCDCYRRKKPATTTISRHIRMTDALHIRQFDNFSYRRKLLAAAYDLWYHTDDYRPLNYTGADLYHFIDTFRRDEFFQDGEYWIYDSEYYWAVRDLALKFLDVNHSTATFK